MKDYESIIKRVIDIPTEKKAEEEEV